MIEKKIHPQQIGFQLAIDVTYSDSWQPHINFLSSELMELTDIVYVALGIDDVCLRVGQSVDSLSDRWGGVLKKQIPAERDGKRKYREHEWAFRDKWRGEPAARRAQFWVKSAKKFKFGYFGDESETSLRGAEEIYLDRYYVPKLSVPLDGRRAA